MRSICIRQSFSLQKKLYCLHIKKENTIKHKRREKEVNVKTLQTECCSQHGRLAVSGSIYSY